MSAFLIPIPSATAHVDEGRGEALQLYSAATSNPPTIDGSIATNSAGEWRDAYIRNVTAQQVGGSAVKWVTLLFMNNDNNLFVGVAYMDTSNDNGDYVMLYFDEGDNRSRTDPVDRYHDDTLTGNNENAVRLYLDYSRRDYFWSGSWSQDSVVNFSGSAQDYGGIHNYEFSVPLDTGVDSGTGSDLNVDDEDEIGFFLEVYEATSASRYVWRETNGWNATIPGPEKPDLGDGWADLQLGQVMDRVLKAQPAAYGNPDLGDGLPITGDTTWMAAEPVDITLTDYAGNTIPATIYSMENGNNLYIGAKIYDDDNDNADTLTIFQDRDAGFGSRDFRLTGGDENAVMLTATGTYTDMSYSDGWFHLDSYQGNQLWWGQEVYDISYAADRPFVYILYNFVSDGGNNDDGWYIDDIQVTGDLGTAMTQTWEAGWGAWANWGANNDWQRGAPSFGFGPAACHGGTNCIGTNLGGFYNNNENSFVRSPMVDLSGYSTASLDFYNYYDFPGGFGDNDVGHVFLYSPQGFWVPDSYFGDGTGGAGNVRYFDPSGTANDRYEFEFSIPMNAGNADLAIATGDTINILFKYYDDDTGTYFYWDQTSNESMLLTDGGAPIVTTVGWGQLETGYPWVEITSPDYGEAVMGTTVVWVDAWDIGGTNNVEYVYISVDDSNWTEATAYTQTTWYYLWNTTAEREGRHTLEARAIDPDGQEWITDPVDVVVDNYDPSLQVIYPTNGDVLGGNETLRVSATETNGQAATPIFQVDGGDWYLMSGSGPYTATWDTSMVLDGQHVINFATWDDAWNVVIRTLTVIVDNTVPICEINYPAAGQYIEGTIEMLVFAKDNIGLAGVNLSIDGGADIPLASPQGDYYSYTMDTSSLTTGTHTLVCNCADLGDNTNTGTPVDIIVDNDDPVISLDNPVGLYVEGVVNVDVAVDEPYLDTLRFKVDGGTWTDIPGSGGLYSQQWDTTVMTDGHHVLTVEAVDMVGHVSTISSTFIVDNNAPGLQVTAPFDGEYIDGLYRFTAVASDAVGIDTVTLDLGPSAYTMLSGENYFYNLDTTTVADGDRVATFTATDLAGHETILEIDIHIDNNAPALTINAPKPGAYIDGAYTMDVTCDDMYLETCQYSVDGGAWKDIGVFNTTAYGDGDHTISIRATDASGKVTQVDVPVHIDNTAPVVMAHYPMAGDYMEGQVIVYAQVIEAVKVADVAFTIGATAVQAEFNPMNGMYEALVDTTTFEDGPVTVKFAVTDAIGHVAEVTEACHIDNTHPTLVPIYPLEGSHIMGTIDVEAQYTDTFQYQLDGGPWAAHDKPLDTTVYPDGPHTVTFRAMDNAGHMKAIDVHVFIDNSPPVVAFVTPVEGQHIYGIADFELSIDEDYIDVIDVGVGEMALVVPYSSPFAGHIDTEALADGEQTITATVSDKAGHVTTVEVKVFVDNSAPSIDTNMGDGKTVEGEVSFRLTISDDTDVDTVYMRIDDGKWKEMVEKNGKYIYDWPTDVEDNGKHTYQVRVVDDLGNEETTTYSIKVENPDYWWVPVLVIIILVVLALFLMMRRGKKGEDESIPSDMDLDDDDDDSTMGGGGSGWAKDIEDGEDEDIDEEDDAKSLKDKKSESEMRPKD